MNSRLAEIIDAHRSTAAQDGRDLGRLLEEAREVAPASDFKAALAKPGLSVIAEVKRRSPSAGALNETLDPVQLSRAYESGGAACVSVLTDQRFFGGSVDDLKAVHNAVALPVLRKDFTVDARDIVDARLIGADAVLLIVAALSDEELASFAALIADLGMTALVEVHDEIEIERALNVGAEVIGVNQRNLKTFEVDPTSAARLRPLLGEDVVTVAESAITSVDDAHRLEDIGYHAVLIGTALVTNGEPTAMLRQMVR